jgi:hypothetical protein
MIFNLYISKQHLTTQGFLLCLSYINVLNNAINENTLAEITSKLGSLPILLLPPVSTNIQYVLEPNWIVGFAAGDGCFSYFTRKRTLSSGVTVLDYSLIFEISQLPHDYSLMLAILNFIGFGNVYMQAFGVMRIRFTTLSVLQHNVLPFFHNNPFPDCCFKSQQYNLWSKAVVTLMKYPKYSLYRQNTLTELLTKLSSLHK